MPFHCTICGEESTRICVWCTKDACSNHLCAKCARCSDCCECDVPLSAEEAAPVDAVAEPAAEHAAEPAVESPNTDFVAPFEPSVFAEPPDVPDPADHDGPQ